MAELIHRYWTGVRPVPSVSGFAEKAAQRFGDVRNWTDDTLPADIRDYVESVDSYVPEESRLTHRANVARLLLLWKLGGVWLDHDSIVIDMPDRNDAWVAWASGRVASSIMHFPPGHPLLQLALDEVKPSSAAVQASGEIMLTRVWANRHLRVHNLPLDSEGRRDPKAQPWAVHAWDSLS